MTVDKPQVGRKQLETIMDASAPDWISAEVGEVREVPLANGQTIIFTKTADRGWIVRDQTKKERKKNNVHVPTAPKTTFDQWCTECKKLHTPGQHIVTTTTTSYKQCEHDGLTLIYQCKNGAKLYGAGKFGLHKNLHDVIIDLAGNVHQESFVGGSRKFHVLKKYVRYHQPEILNLDWEDYGLPPVGMRFWRTLLELIEGKDVTVCCWGGHGRTGTAIASLMVADGVPPTDAMRHIWKVYCEKAIETLSQENYLFELVGESRPTNVPVAVPAGRSKLHSQHCRCTDCMQEAVDEWVAANEATWSSETKYLHDADDVDTEFKRYQAWMRDQQEEQLWDWKTDEANPAY